jgi:uncharacterized protein (TIGR04255 family)
MPKTSKESAINHIHIFKSPPLIETVLGVQFKNVPKLNNALLYGFWSSLKPEWPNVEEAPLLPPIYEKFDNTQWLAAMVNVQIQLMPMAHRLRIFDSNRSRMIQVQNGRFHYNWIATAGEKYPSYSVVRPEFDKLYKRFKEYLSENGIENLEEDQWEVTYISHIPKATLWNDIVDVQKIFPGLPALKTDEVKLDNFFTRFDLEIKPQQGRLHVQINNANDQKSSEVIRVDFTARGPVASAGLDLDKGLNLGRKVSVETFFKLTSSEAHTYWGYKNAR